MNIFKRFKRWINKILNGDGQKWSKAVILIMEGTKDILNSSVGNIVTDVLVDKFNFITGDKVAKVKAIVYTEIEKRLFQLKLMQDLSGIESMEDKVDFALLKIQDLDKSKKAEFWLGSAADIRVEINKAFEDGKLSVKETAEIIQMVYDMLKKSNEI